MFEALAQAVLEDGRKLVYLIQAGLGLRGMYVE